MPLRQFNKLWGLKKLREIAKGSNRFRVIPFKVYEKPEQFRLKHALEQPRLLVRTDEKGRTYKKLSWARMPRIDINKPRKPFNKSKNEKMIQRELEKIGNTDSMGEKLEEEDKRNARLIVHPTKKRRQIAFTGQITIENLNLSGEIVLRISLAKNPSAQVLVHRNLFLGSPFVYKIKKNRFVPTEKTKEQLRAISRQDKETTTSDRFYQTFGFKAIGRQDKQTTKIIGNCLAFLKKAIKTKQVKPNRVKTEICFVTFKDNPTTLEFYDLQEFRETEQ